MESGQIDLRLSYFDLAEMLDKVVQQMNPQARKKQISILLQIIPALDQIPLQITADEKALIQVFVNLIGNAIKFTPPNGRVNITLQRVHAGFEVSISDTGIGIPSQDIPLLFTRFFRGTNAIEEEIPGTGIGLFIVHATLKKHGGKIKVSSELGKGSQFDIWLPEIAA